MSSTPVVCFRMVNLFPWYRSLSPPHGNVPILSFFIPHSLPFPFFCFLWLLFFFFTSFTVLSFLLLADIFHPLFLLSQILFLFLFPFMNFILYGVNELNIDLMNQVFDFMSHFDSTHMVSRTWQNPSIDVKVGISSQNITGNVDFNDFRFRSYFAIYRRHFIYSILLS